MKSLQKMIVILLMVLGLSSLVSAEVKNFYINGVDNSKKDADFSAKFIESTLPEIGKVVPLHNTDNGVLTNFYGLFGGYVFFIKSR